MLHHGIERADVDPLEKPFHSEALAACIRQMLDDARLRLPANSA